MCNPREEKVETIRRLMGYVMYIRGQKTYGFRITAWLFFQRKGLDPMACNVKMMAMESVSPSLVEDGYIKTVGTIVCHLIFISRHV